MLAPEKERPRLWRLWILTSYNRVSTWVCISVNAMCSGDHPVGSDQGPSTNVIFALFAERNLPRPWMWGGVFTVYHAGRWWSLTTPCYGTKNSIMCYWTWKLAYNGWCLYNRERDLSWHFQTWHCLRGEQHTLNYYLPLTSWDATRKGSSR